MDKQLLKAYVRTIVEEEVTKLLPQLLGEAIAEIKEAQKINESVTSPTTKQKIDRSKLAELMGINYNRTEGTISATTKNISPSTLVAKDAAGNSVQVPASAVSSEVIDAINKDYSALMKKMKLT